jgi:hypothetical protein
MQERERARRLATNIVALALGLTGVTLLVLAVVLVVRGGAALLFLSLIVGLLGLGLAAAGFFFQLVPLRVDALAQEKRDHDLRQRER